MPKKNVCTWSQNLEGGIMTHDATIPNCENTIKGAQSRFVSKRMTPALANMVKYRFQSGHMTTGWSLGLNSCSRMSTSARPCLDASVCKYLHTGTRVLDLSAPAPVTTMKLKSVSKRHGTPLASSFWSQILKSKEPVLKPKSSWECTVIASVDSLPRKTEKLWSMITVGFPWRPGTVALLSEAMKQQIYFTTKTLQRVSQTTK